MEDKIQPYRQPLITATGIILGFILNFASNWVKTENALTDSLAYFVGIAVLLGTICLITVLYRMLNMKYPRETWEEYYNKTFLIFMLGICSAFLGVLVDMFANFMTD